MDTLAAAARDHAGAITLIILVFAALYIAACALWPFAACRWCEGGKKRSPGGRAWRTCGRCGGTGARVRLGRRLWSGFGDLRERGRR